MIQLTPATIVNDPELLLRLDELQQWIAMYSAGFGFMIPAFVAVSIGLFRAQRKQKAEIKRLDGDMWKYWGDLNQKITDKSGHVPNIVPSMKKQLRIGRWVVASIEEAKPVSKAPNDYGGF